MIHDVCTCAVQWLAENKWYGSKYLTEPENRQSTEEKNKNLTSQIVLKD